MQEPPVADVDELPWLESLNKEFGWKLLAFISMSQHVVKGFVRGFCYGGWNYVVREYAIPASQMAIYQGVVQLPWALKPIIGFVSDCYPILGFAKMPYFLLSTIMGTVALGILGSYQRSLAIDSVVGLLFYVSLSLATIDLLTEAAYAKQLRDKPAHGPALLSFVWGGITIVGVFTTIFSGLIISFDSPWTLYNVSVIPFGLFIVPVLQNWIMEPCLTDSQVQAQRKKVFQQFEGVVLAFILLCATLVLAYSGMTLSVKANGIISLCVLFFVVTSFSVMLSPVIAKVNAFGIIQTSMNLSLGSASFFFMMDTPAEFPGGPNFSTPFVSIVLPLVGSVFSIFGVILYNQHAGLWTYQRMYIVGNVLVAVTSLCDVIFFLRWNKHLGMSDELFVLGSASFQSVMEEWLWMPSCVILGQLCPRGMEAIMYANLASCHNLGNTISNNLGAWLLDYVGVAPTGVSLETHQFDNLWLASLISTILPMLPVVLVPWFIPNKLNTQPILDNPTMSINEGSLLHQWLGWGSVELPDDHHQL